MSSLDYNYIISSGLVSLSIYITFNSYLTLLLSLITQITESLVPNILVF